MKPAAGDGRRATGWTTAFAAGLFVLAGFACANNENGRDSVSGTTDSSQAKPTRRPPPAAHPRSVLFVGTSLTAGLGLEPDSAYPTLIQQKIDSTGVSATVVNAGVSGETTAGLLERLDWLLRAPFDVLVLETGANDGLRGIPAATVRQNVRRALERIRAARPAARILLVQMEALPNLGPRYASEFHELYPALAKEAGVTLMPFLLDGVAGRRELNQGDGIHPNQRGEHIVADNIWRSLRPVLDSLAATP